MDVLLAANALAALVSAGSSVAAVARPGLLFPGGEGVSAGVRFYSWAYAVRAVPLGLATALLLAVGAPAAVLWPVLAVDGAAQVGDSAIGMRRRNRGMAGGAATFALLHLATAAWLAR